METEERKKTILTIEQHVPERRVVPFGRRRRRGQTAHAVRQAARKHDIGKVAPGVRGRDSRRRGGAPLLPEPRARGLAHEGGRSQPPVQRPRRHPRALPRAVHPKSQCRQARHGRGELGAVGQQRRRRRAQVRKHGIDLRERLLPPFLEREQRGPAVDVLVGAALFDPSFGLGESARLLHSRLEVALVLFGRAPLGLDRRRRTRPLLLLPPHAFLLERDQLGVPRPRGLVLARVALPRQLVLVLCQLRLRLRVLLHRLPLLLPPDALLFDALLLGVRLELGLFGLELLGLCYLLLPGELDDLCCFSSLLLLLLFVC
jgi:hypothetical protein